MNTDPSQPRPPTETSARDTATTAMVYENCRYFICQKVPFMVNEKEPPSPPTSDVRGMTILSTGALPLSASVYCRKIPELETVPVTASDDTPSLREYVNERNLMSFGRSARATVNASVSRCSFPRGASAFERLRTVLSISRSDRS